MIALLQRVTQAQVAVAGLTIAQIDQGLLVFIGVERDDTEQQAERLLQRLLHYRVFADQDGKMNRSLLDVHGGLLLVPQFTLAADTHKGLRPSFTPAAEPQHGEWLFDYLAQQARAQHDKVETGRFGADMQVTLTNDGPVTFWLQA
ncbi:MAG: D-aminoacyl-tRNA deacylase [Gammaproteobacteria bacterium]|nr:D-aminoacyl-tRNA deacylase [Gammaproteobacteria bacterium]MCL5669245.1 D-aminoacyl-tRNA deacylase [Gammaproteobacteria bacterium]